MKRTKKKRMKRMRKRIMERKMRRKNDLRKEDKHIHLREGMRAKYLKHKHFLV